jgi:hypothetical protein
LPACPGGRKARRVRPPRGQAWGAAPSSAPRYEPVCCETIRRAILRDPEGQLRLLRELADEYARLGEHDRADDVLQVLREEGSLDRDAG